MARQPGFERGAERFQFGLSFHHAILDGWSVATLLTAMGLPVQGYTAASTTTKPSVSTNCL